MGVISRGQEEGFPPRGREAAGISAGQPCDRQALHADAAPAPVVDQPFQRLAEGVEEHLIDPFDQLAVAVQLHRVEVEAALVQHGDATLELRRGDGEADGRRRAMMSAGSGSTQVKSRAPASTSRWVMRRKPSGAGNCSSWWISSCSSGHAARGSAASPARTRG
jgi:hypothetical protein